MPTTPKLLLPYPGSADPADVPTDMGELALQIDNVAGAASGLATLDATGKVPAAQIPASGASIPARHSTRAKLVVAQALGAAVAGGVPVVLDGEDWDTDNLHSTTVNNTRITIPTGLAGVWVFSGYAEFPNSGGGTVVYYLGIRKNGATYIGGGGHSLNYGPGNRQVAGAPAIDVAAVGDYYELMAVAGGATLTVATFAASLLSS